MRARQIYPIFKIIASVCDATAELNHRYLSVIFRCAFLGMLNPSSTSFLHLSSECGVLIRVQTVLMGIYLLNLQVGFTAQFCKLWTFEHILKSEMVIGFGFVYLFR